jgi:hypothetical protein
MHAAKEDEALAASLRTLFLDRDVVAAEINARRPRHPSGTGSPPGVLDLADVAGFVGGVHEFEK